MKKHLATAVSAAALLVASAGLATAADFDPVPIPEVPTVYDWSGAYIGIKGGGVFDGRSELVDQFGTSSGRYDVDGFTIGLMTGYNLQIGNWVLGLDSDYSYADIDGSVVNAVCPIKCETEIDYLGTTRARIGYAFDRFLPYVTGGVATAYVDATGNGFNADSEFHFGFAAGGGLEWAMMDGWMARIEYLYLDLKDDDHIFGGGAAAFAGDVRFDEMHVVRAGIAIDADPLWDTIFGRR